jgi:hypothetical protein
MKTAGRWYETFGDRTDVVSGLLFNIANNPYCSKKDAGIAFLNADWRDFSGVAASFGGRSSLFYFYPKMAKKFLAGRQI